MNWLPRWYDADGNEVTLAEAELLFCSEARIVAQDTVRGLWVSTVHQVLDLRMLSAGPPLIFETAVFTEAPSPERMGDMLDCWRTSTRHAALAQHDQVCAAIRDATDIALRVNLVRRNL